MYRGSRGELVMVNCCAMCTIYQFEKCVMLCDVNKLFDREKFNNQATIYKQVTMETN